MRRGNSFGFKIALGYVLFTAPYALADEASAKLPPASLPALNADRTPSQRVITDRNGVVLDERATPALAFLNVTKSSSNQPLQFSLDATANKILDEELASGLGRFSAKAAAGFIMDVNTGEIIALSSIEDGNPPAAGNAPANGVTQTYEIGSSAKLMTVAMALDAGKVDLASRIDARELHYGAFKIHDYGPQKRMLTLPEVVEYSSNIAIARLAQRVGTTGQKAFLEKMGQLDRPETVGIEAIAPIVPKKWTGLQTVTTAIGAEFDVSPLQAGIAIAAMVNGGTMLRPTMFKSEQASPEGGRRVISSDTSAKIRHLLRLNVEEGSAKKAEVAGYYVGGATSTAECFVKGSSAAVRVMATFIGIFPADKPKYLVMTLLDDPKGLPETFGFHTAPWNAAPVAAKVIERTAPILGVEYRATPPANRFSM